MTTMTMERRVMCEEKLAVRGAQGNRNSVNLGRILSFDATHVSTSRTVGPAQAVRERLFVLHCAAGGRLTRPNRRR